ncbi:hypothetical protein CDA63_19900 [Hymenobacter amundsenii]|uniref:Fibronectin type-III domain-containing protein n=1 Tax=Hymenobacter amundsenii TaxID=2006685 RepID=A0A246FFR5_9BACT|nr:T9SS type A sorting domain-containing protein [Hymenobacter amundsenii]OWP61346.1 hypothetical protein CDA63_19900 [Hymenobacter amundsenii]
MILRYSLQDISLSRNIRSTWRQRCIGGWLLATVLGLGTAQAQGSACAPATALVADSIGQFSAVVRFVGATGTAGYTVTTTPATQAYTLPAEATAVRLRMLMYDTNYTVQILRQCGGGQIAAPAQLSLRTAEYCGGPNDVQPVNIRATSADIIFGPGAPGTARNYTVDVHRIQQGVNSTFVGSYNVTQSPLQLTGLLPNTMYGITIFTNCTNGQSSGGTGGPGLPFTTLAATPTSTAHGRAAAPFVVYPNPAYTALTVQLPATAPRTELRVQLVDATGRVSHTQLVRCGADGVLVLALPPQPAGWYILRLQGTGGYQASKPLHIL